MELGGFIEILTLHPMLVHEAIHPHEIYSRPAFQHWKETHTRVQVHSVLSNVHFIIDKNIGLRE